MNEERIQQVLSIEKEATQIYETAVRESEQLLISANQEVDAILEKSKKEAQQAAEQLVAEARGKNEDTHILSVAQEKVNHAINLSKGNLELAVAYVLDRALGKE